MPFKVCYCYFGLTVTRQRWAQVSLFPSGMPYKSVSQTSINSAYNIKYLEHNKVKLNLKKIFLS